ncbi:autophagy-related protein 13-domain-containing protein [Dichomitus squalens]|uniref:Autophagy-related protein 13 n=1 Tax=Dichomitus squalens TaxID=114155 RepID=A0A4Q9MLI0_9APHY|nr:autophagy-related protein 13-domain-containing protein [Dichomitus squalens]
MSNETQKADQIAHRLYSKLALVVNHARATIEPSPAAKVDKWFNLETPDPELFREHTRVYRSISTSPAVPLFQLQVLLCTPELATNQVLVYLSPDSSRVRIDPTPRYIVLESWNLEYAPHPYNHHQTQDVAPSTMYKHGIPLFRSIFTLLRVLPVWKLARRLRRRTGGSRSGNFSIRLRVDGVDGDIRADEVLSFDTAPPALAPVLQTDKHSLPPITHPMGELAVSVTYLTSPNFQLDTLESLLSSRFLSLDEGPDFTPTLIKNQQRDSISGSPGSLPLRTSLPRSPPRSVADRFVIPPPSAATASSHGRSPSFSSAQGARGSPAGSPRLGNIPLPVTRNLSGAGMGTSGVSDSSSIRQGAGSISSREEVSALAARIRRESMQGRSSAESPTGVPIRRTPITTVNAFKSSTISSGSPSLHSPSPSLRQQSPLSTGAGPSLPGRPAQSPTSSRVPPSPIGSGANFPSSPITPARPSPPFVPSNLGSGRPSSGEGVSASPLSASPRKRYSSSFGQRYATPSSGVGEASPRGSPGSGPKEIVQPPAYLTGNTDDDDISAFVQEIDARRPLLSRREGSESPVPPPPLTSHTRTSTIDEESESSRSSDVALRPRTLSTPVLTTESAVDERLRDMKEAFMASLEGFGSRGSRREASASTDRTATGPASTSRRPLGDPIAYPSVGRRESPLGDSPQDRDIAPGAAGGILLPPAYVRPRLASTGSVRSGFSVASEEVLGRMDPELGGSDERRSRRGPLGS